MAHIRSFPTEILSAIFVLACDGESVRFFGPRRGTLPTSHNIDHVCKTWRTIAQRLRTIWEYLIIIDLEEVPRGPDHRLRARIYDYAEPLKALLRRSTDYPLHVRFGGFYRHHHEVDPEEVFPFLQALFDERKRWSSIHFSNLGALLSFEGFDYSLDAPFLRTLGIDGLKYLGDRAPFEVNAPLLSKLGLWEPFSPVSILILPWNQITDLSIMHNDSYPYAQELLLILRSTPQLISLQFRGECIIDVPGSPQEAISLGHLRTLKVVDIGDEAAFTKYLLPLLSAPQLQSFDLMVLTRLNEMEFNSEAQNSAVLPVADLASFMTSALQHFRLFCCYSPSLGNNYWDILEDVEFFRVQDRSPSHTIQPEIQLLQRLKRVHVPLRVRTHVDDLFSTDFLDNLLETTGEGFAVQELEHSKSLLTAAEHRFLSAASVSLGALQEMCAFSDSHSGTPHCYLYMMVSPMDLVDA